MEESNVLKVVTDFKAGSNIIIHPNEGAVLGLLTYAKNVKIFFNSTVQEFNTSTGSFIEGELLLENNCKNGTILISPKIWDKVGKANEIKLFLDKDKVLISKM